MLYQNKTILLATQHKKERAIAPPFKRAFNSEIWVPQDFNTDLFGTFSGELERSGTQHEALILKARKAAENYDYNYVISSEGSFGPHPTAFYIPGAVEMLAFLDLTQDLTIVESLITEETNYAHFDLTTAEEPTDFLRKTGFPEHALIVRELETNTILAKGLSDTQSLYTVLKAGLKNSNKVRLETDMRAHMNPTRMKVIQSLAEKLVNRISNICPDCHTPGFGAISVDGHLLCEVCDTPTELYAKKVLNCLKCDFKSYQERDDHRLCSPQQYCPYCNP